jgi:hypothetical protein
MERLITLRKIAIFIGLEYGFAHKKDQYNYNQCEEGYVVPNFINPEPNEEDSNHHIWHVSDLRFDSSWDWLMLAVEKIEDQENTTVTIGKDYCEIEVEKYGYVSNGNWCDTPKMKIVFEAVKDYIDWYDEKTGEITKAIDGLKKQALID